MDGYELLARSEWPLVAAIAVLVLSRSISGMLDRVHPKKVSGFGFKIEFERALGTASDLIARRCGRILVLI